MFSSCDCVYNDECNCLLVTKCLRKQSACELHGKAKWSSTTVPFGVWTQADKTKPLNIYRECNTRNIMLNEAIFSQVWPLLQTPADGKKKIAYHSGHKVSWQSQIVNRSKWISASVKFHLPDILSVNTTSFFQWLNLTHDLLDAVNGVPLRINPHSDVLLLLLFLHIFLLPINPCEKNKE